MKILRGCLLACLALFALAPPLAAANPWQNESLGLSILRSELPPCTSGGRADNRAFTVRDCVSSTSCASGGTATVRWVCDSGTYRALNYAAASPPDLSGYVPYARTSDNKDILGKTGSDGHLIFADTGTYLHGPVNGSTNFLGWDDQPEFLISYEGKNIFRGTAFAASISYGFGYFEVRNDRVEMFVGEPGLLKFAIREARATSSVPFGIPSAASLPACDTTIAPAGTTAFMWDTTGPDLCACPEGGDRVAVDGSGTCE